MNATDVRAYLDSFINYELKPLERDRVSFKLDRVHKLLELVGNPHISLKVIHVAGSKGKGSTCAILASILKENGLKVGLYTSPHLENYRERIRICSLEEKKIGDDIFPGVITEQQLADMLNILQPAIDQMDQQYSALGRVSFFELFSALAFLFFKEHKVDWVILETGVGGRLDATNVCRSTVAVITSISFEHMALLGNTLTEIAGEKAAIIKADTKYVIIAPQVPEAMEVFERHCKSLNKAYISVQNDIKWQMGGIDGQQMVFDVLSTKKSYIGLKTSLIGEHQAVNAATAIAVCEVLVSEGINFKENSIERGVENVFWPGRFEVIHKRPTIILDSAHNSSSATYLVDTLKRFTLGGRIIAVVGTSVDKDQKGICQAINLIANHIIFTRANHPRAHMFIKEEVEELIDCAHSMTFSVGEAMTKALVMAGAADTIVITGSVFVVSEARQWARGNSEKLNSESLK